LEESLNQKILSEANKMLRSMYTAISSLNMHQTYMDVIADNLANTNTTGFKASKVTFKDQFAQLSSAGSPPSATTGGINPTQIGLGAEIGYISAVFTQGSLESTGKNLDLALQGDGFFIYQNGSAQYYSRDGAIGVDASGYLTNSSSGLRIQGWMVGANGVVNTNGPTSDLTVPTGATLAQLTSNVVLGGNLNSEAANGDNYNSTIGAYDSLGVLHDVTVQYTRTAGSTWNWSVTQVDGAAVTGRGAGTLTFDTDGSLASNTVTTPVTLPGSAGAQNNFPVTIDMSELSMLAEESNVTLTSQDGLPAGTFSEVYVGANTGEVFMLFSNGMKEEIGQLALARFTNPSGLLRTGQNMFQIGLNSGDPQIGAPETGGRAAVVPG
jgi:flagellar hook protein FlgE